jgi:hypothetical protein
MGVQVRFHFASRFEIDISQLSQSLFHDRTLCCLDIPSNNNSETKASKIGFRGILKQLVSTGSSEQIVQYHSGSRNFAHYDIIIILLRNSLHSLKYCILNRFLNIFDFDKILIFLNSDFQLFLISSLVNFCSATMASKKDKEKTDSKALVLKPESAVATSSPISSIELANRFSPFSSDLPVSYSSTLISPFDPFADFPQKSRVPFIQHKKPSAYMVLSYFQHLFTIEMNRASIKSANKLSHSYFPQNFHWIPEHSKKTLAFYTNILIQTKSIHFKPIYCQTTPGKLIFHHAYINNILSEKDWGNHPSIPKFLSDNSPYNYYDYIDAWSKFFLYQTPNCDHSWFITFDRENSIRFLSLWFSRWWMYFGLIPDILPLQLVDSFSLFKNHAKTDAYGSKFSLILHFSKKYKVPRILKWQYVIVGDKLERHWYIKWWDKFRFDDIVENVKEFCRAPKALDLPTTQNLPSNPAQKLPTNAPPALLTPDAFLPPVKQESPLTSSSSSKKKTSLSKKKKKALMKAFLESFEIGSDEDEEESASDASSEPIIDPQRDLFGNSGFDSQ